MSRDIRIPGECLVRVKGKTGSTISSLSELGLAEDPVIVTPHLNHEDINVNAWGKAPMDVQWMLGWADITINLIHFDRDILNECIRLSMGAPSVVGRMARAGTRLGGGGVRFAAGNNYIGLNLTSPVEGRPWRFLFAYMPESPASFPMGVQRAVVQTRWRAIPYTDDPWGNASGAQGNTTAGGGAGEAVIWDHTADT